MTVHLATSVDEALQQLAAGATVVCGGTDLVVGHRQGKAPLPDRLVAIDRVPELGEIHSTDAGLVLGAAVSHARLVSDPAVAARYSAIADGAALVGSPATRHVGTVGGNVMNGSPAMDTGAPLLVLGAVAELASASGERTVPLDELWIGPGQTSAKP